MSRETVIVLVKYNFCSVLYSFQLVESIPENLTYTKGEPSHPSTYHGIKELLALANETIEIASFYWTMRGDDLPVSDPSDWQVR